MNINIPMITQTLHISADIIPIDVGIRYFNKKLRIPSLIPNPPGTMNDRKPIIHAIAFEPKSGSRTEYAIG